MGDAAVGIAGTLAVGLGAMTPDERMLSTSTSDAPTTAVHVLADVAQAYGDTRRAEQEAADGLEAVQEVPYADHDDPPEGWAALLAAPSPNAADPWLDDEAVESEESELEAAESDLHLEVDEDIGYLEMADHDEADTGSDLSEGGETGEGTAGL